ncbi:histidinol-phosphate transaminase [Cytophagaceae bacterium DM2B3-1]|uniref:Histidinol-phosphate transaminase n=1 Tax=Xanthocytophaga flava TaxID=3048013 RepID=A0AAE3QGG7_9BACT|nr:histidinol-phosphate transaminase [Xanthocytophaga flavus]MDJ1466256.1 histidinol-phosphate transaminase [Xanthocytophaga flavus]MDJ1478927.1 histidinol-phosphate transaminase [Xanthocytophaga flavus]MDJ1495460.1 histidinol-phosphate transaminase [Xanthocytophaga flavus]
MLTSSINRRQWLKLGAMFTTGAALGTSLNASGMSQRKKFLADIPAIKARLSANENPFGPSEKAKKALMQAVPDSYLYPRESLMQLRKLIAQEEGVSEDSILLGAGSGGLLTGTALYFAFKAGSDSHILSGDPSYMQLVRAATQVGCGWEKVSLTKDYDYDYDALAAKVSDKTSLVYICNPNNPTGIVSNSQKLMAFCESVSPKKPIFIDEAYIDYADDPKKTTMMECVRKGQNVLIARTFSKVHGFAGLRIGYLVAKPETIKEISKFTPGPSAISATSAQAALASYQDKEFIKYSIAKNNECKAFLYKVLKEQGYNYLPSATNFVFFPIKMDGKRFLEEMSKRGVSIRTEWQYAGQNWCRVSLGTMEQMKMFADAFKEIA